MVWPLVLALFQSPIEDDKYPHLPALSNLKRFPCRAHADRQEEICREWRIWYLEHIPLDPARREFYEAVAWSLHLRAQAWQKLSEAHRLYDHDGEAKRRALDDLQVMLSAEDWQLGRMPCDLQPVPRLEYLIFE